MTSVVTLLLIILALLHKHSTTSNFPVRVHFMADSVQVFGSDGHLLWTHQFSGVLDPEALASSKLEDYVRIGDFLGDGRREVVIVAPVRRSPNPQDFPRSEIDCFSESGALSWSYLPQEVFHFGERSFSGPWIPHDIRASVVGPHHAIFVAFDQSPWGYSFVEQIDPASGHGTVRFVNSGMIHRLDELHTSRGTYLLVGGFNNEFDGGSLAIFDEARPFAASPQTVGTRHACVSCPTGSPDYYIVFPRSEINRLRHFYQTPVTGSDFNGDQAEVTKLELYPNSPASMRYLFQTEPTLRLLSLRFDSTYEMLHRELEQTGELDHPLVKCPERLRPERVRVWTPADGWKEWNVKPVAP